MAILHAVRCRECEFIEERFHVVNGDYGACPESACRSRDRTWVPRGFNTDVFGSPQYSDATGQWHSSTRDKIKCAAEAGFTEAGDKVHGARPELRMTGAVFSGGVFAGMGKTSSGERERTRAQ